MTQPLTDAINALTRYANEVTGQSDTTLSDAVRTLCDGYGGGGGSGYEVVASGTFVGNDAYCITLPVGKKFPQTDLFFRVQAVENEFPSDSKYKFVKMYAMLFKENGHFNLATNGTLKDPINDNSITVDGTNVAFGDSSRIAYCVINKTVATTLIFNQFKLNRDANGFSIYLGNSNPSYQFPSSITYEWEVVYFGSDPTNDIVEIP